MKNYRNEAEFNAAWGDTDIMPQPTARPKQTAPRAVYTPAWPSAADFSALILVAACVLAVAFSAVTLYLRLKGH